VRIAIVLVLFWAGPALAGEPLLQALEFVPAEMPLVLVEFTDWSLINGAVFPEGLEELVRATISGYPAPSGFALNRAGGHKDAWGWDPTDLVWEARITVRNTAPAFVLKLADPALLSSVEERFIARGFDCIQTRSHVLLSHPFDPTVDWLKSTELAILNTALLQGGYIIASSSLPTVLGLLACWYGELPALAGDGEAVELASRLQGCPGVVLLPGPGSCYTFQASAILDLYQRYTPEEVYRRARELLEETAGLHPYWGLGLGYRYREGELEGLIAFHYPSAALAQADLPLRVRLAQEGTSVQANAPYAEAAFTLVEGKVEGRDLLLVVEPLQGQPLRLLRLIYYRDIAFAACP